MKFNNEISVGNVIAALTICGTVAAGIFTSYGKLNEHDMRIAATERALTDVRKEQGDYQTEMRANIAKVVDILTDLRIQAGKGVIRAR
jgi:roadblock/LC7 domain-containing protein